MIDAAIDEITELRKENAELKEKLKQFEWRPIETAPKPNKRILLSDGTNIFVGAYYQDGDVYNAGFYVTNLTNATEFKNAKYWMSLPPAPVNVGVIEKDGSE